MQIGLINSLESVEISFKSLRPHYGTGVTTTSVGAYGEKKYSYRNGVMTSQGDILETVWVAAIELLAEKMVKQPCSKNQKMHSFQAVQIIQSL